MVYKHRTQTLISTFVVQRPVQVCKKKCTCKGDRYGKTDILISTTICHLGCNVCKILSQYISKCTKCWVDKIRLA